MNAASLVEDLGQLVRQLEPGCLSGSDASRLMAVFERGEKLCAAAKAMLAARASETQEWSRAGARSAEEWLAGRWGVASSTAKSALKTANTASKRPELEEAMRGGELSPAQAQEIATAAEQDPASTRRLLHSARTRTLQGLRDDAKAVRTAGRSREDDEARRERLHRQRYLRMWTDPDGAGRIDARLAPEAYAEFVACLHPFERQAIDAARKEGRRDDFGAYRADAWVAMAQRARSGGSDDKAIGPPKEIVAVIDHAALVRGHVEGEERCYIDGIGPVPVSTIRAMMATDDPFLFSVIEDATDIRAVCYASRHVSRKQRIGLTVRDRYCSVPGCDVTHGLERDHFPPYEQTQHTRIEELRRLCHHHHQQVTHYGATLTGRPGHWEWTPPPPGPFDDPDPFDDTEAPDDKTGSPAQAELFGVPPPG